MPKTYQELQHEKAVLEKELKRRSFEKTVKKLRKQVYPSRFRRLLHYGFTVADYTATGLYYCGLGVLALCSWFLSDTEPLDNEVN